MTAVAQKLPYPSVNLSKQENELLSFGLGVLEALVVFEKEITYTMPVETATSFIPLLKAAAQAYKAFAEKPGGLESLADTMNDHEERAQ